MVVFDNTVQGPLDCKEIQLVHPKGSQFWILDWKDWCWSWSSNILATWCKELTHLKNPDSGKDWRWEENGTTENEMVGWHHQLNGHEFEQTPGVCADRKAWSAAVHGMAKNQTRLSNWTELMNLTFQVPTQYSSLQHLTSLPSPVTSTTGCCFCLAPSLPSLWYKEDTQKVLLERLRIKLFLHM